MDFQPRPSQLQQPLQAMDWVFSRPLDSNMAPRLTPSGSSRESLCLQRLSCVTAFDWDYWPRRLLDYCPATSKSPVQALRRLSDFLLSSIVFLSMLWRRQQQQIALSLCTGKLDSRLCSSLVHQFSSVCDLFNSPFNWPLRQLALQSVPNSWIIESLM